MKRPNRNVVIRYNLTQNEREGIYFYGFEDAQAARDIHIYNNTHVVENGRTVTVFPRDRTPVNSLFENNIFYFEGKGVWGKNARGINTVFRNNLYYNIEPHASETRPMVGRPGFERPGTIGHQIDLATMAALQGYRLRPGSPGIDAGRTIEGNGGRDILGTEVKAGTADMGAIEYDDTRGARNH
jgi:hypothetical protein